MCKIAKNFNDFWTRKWWHKPLFWPLFGPKWPILGPLFCYGQTEGRTDGAGYRGHANRQGWSKKRSWTQKCVHKHQPPLWTFKKLPKLTFAGKIPLTDRIFINSSHMRSFIITDLSELIPSQKFILLQKYHKKNNILHIFVS